MGHPALENETPFAFEALYLTDEEARPVLVTLVKATYRIEDGRGGAELVLADEQAPPELAGTWWGEPGDSSPVFEAETAFAKPKADVVLLGHARAPRMGTREMEVSLRVGSQGKRVRIIGDRTWIKRLGRVTHSDPEPFEAIPLIYERSFGGWDRSHLDPARHDFDPRNPVGTGYRAKKGRFEEGVRLPNLEDPKRALKGNGDTPPPAGFGFLAPHWRPRADHAGTYDEAWRSSRMPALPADFNRLFLNAAPVDQQFAELNGDESIEVHGATPGGRLAFRLPGQAPPECLVERAGADDQRIQTRLDTVVIDADRELVFLLWRAMLGLREGAHEVRSIEVTAEMRVEVRPR